MERIDEITKLVTELILDDVADMLIGMPDSYYKRELEKRAHKLEEQLLLLCGIADEVAARR